MSARKASGRNVREDERSTVQVKLRLPPEIAEELDDAARRWKVTRSGAVARLLGGVVREWIVKDSSDHPYMCAVGPGSCWGPDLSDALRFSTRFAALKAAADAALESPVGSCVRVVRVVRRKA